MHAELDTALAALPPDACHLLTQVTTATIRHPQTGQWTPVRAEDGSTLARAITEMTIGALRVGVGGPHSQLLDVPVTGWEHPANCPMCAHQAAPGPRVYGLWLTRAWEGTPDHLRIMGAGVLEQFANAESAAELVDAWYGRYQQKRFGALGHTLRTLRVPADGAVPTYHDRVIAETTQLWIWEQPPTGDPAAWWPDWVLSCEHGQVRRMSGGHLRKVRAGTPQQRATEPATRDGFLRSTVDGVRITLWRDGRGTRLVSILDLQSPEPGRRILADGSVLPLDGSQPGLTVFGRTQVDRPPAADLGRLAPEYARLAI